jgi:hypothetical protein
VHAVVCEISLPIMPGSSPDSIMIALMPIVGEAGKKSFQSSVVWTT